MFPLVGQNLPLRRYRCPIPDRRDLERGRKGAVGLGRLRRYPREDQEEREYGYRLGPRQPLPLGCLRHEKVRPGRAFFRTARARRTSRAFPSPRTSLASTTTRRERANDAWCVPFIHAWVSGKDARPRSSKRTESNTRPWRRISTPKASTRLL
jgi:hypothetical protein